MDKLLEEDALRHVLERLVDPWHRKFATDCITMYINYSNKDRDAEKPLNKYLINVKPPYTNFMAHVTTVGDAEIVDVYITNN